MNSRRSTLREIRRLAFHAKRSEATREVLHDVLLQSFPDLYSDVMRRAVNQAKVEARGKDNVMLPYPHAYRHVIFRPDMIRFMVGPGRKRVLRFLGRLRARESRLFAIFESEPSRLPNDVIVFQTRALIKKHPRAALD